jgi:FtsP/CotA-like multicopper oxidase with cupredoxin domain
MEGLTRRRFVQVGAASAAGLMLLRPGRPATAIAQVGGGTLDAAAIAKFRSPLVVPPAMPRAGRAVRRGGPNADVYEIAVRQFDQQVLPPGLPSTTVWSYGSAAHPETFNYPAFTIEARWRRPVRVRWINDLRDPATGRFLPHLLPVDPTLHWANPPGGVAGRDERPSFASTPGPYTGPVPIVTHLHGSEGVQQESDGYAEAWYLPAASDVPAGFATTGTFYDVFRQSSPLGAQWSPGSAVFEYPNTQRAGTLWYHDHTLGMTRLNVYAGPAGFYLLRGGPSDAVRGLLPRGRYEIPLAIQDRSFDADGSLFYPGSRALFDGFAGPYIPDSDVSPIWNPEFFGTAMVVNGRTWPSLEVEQRRYRFRLLNGCNSRFLILRHDNGLPFWQIGADGGFLPAPVRLEQIVLAPAERADVIVDFTNVPVGTEIVLQNLGPDEPFGGGTPGVDFPAADPQTTGQVMQLRVVRSRHHDASTPPGRLRLPKLPTLGAAAVTRRLPLLEADSDVLPGVGPRAALLGTMDGAPRPLEWRDPITEHPRAGATEVWELHNFTPDAHPIHIHERQFLVVGRRPLAGGPSRPPEPGERGYKDTVIAYPGEITSVKARFGTPGRFVWHCHIVEHEDNEMMRPYQIG